MKYTYKVLLTGLGTLLIFVSGVYFGIGANQDKTNWLALIPFAFGYISICTARNTKQETKIIRR